jgi:hypothetical protein
VVVVALPGFAVVVVDAGIDVDEVDEVDAVVVDVDEVVVVDDP